MNKKARILVVDDDEGTRKSLGLIIKRKSYRVETAGTGGEALEKAWGKNIDVALVDLKLPDMEGINLIAPLKEMNPDLAVIMITGFASVETAIQALNKGASAYITKPLNIDELCSKVEAAIAKQRLLAENKRLVLERKRGLDERKRAEKALRNSEEYYRSLIENSQDAMVIVAGDGTISYGSPSVERMLGYKFEELIGADGLLGFAHPDDIPSVIKTFGEIIENPGTPLKIELRIRHKDSSWRVVEAVANNLLTDPAVKGIVVNWRDVTGRKRAEDVLRESEEGFKRLVEDMNDGYIVVQDCKVVFANARSAEMFRYTPEEVIGKYVKEFLIPEVGEALVDLHARRLRREAVPQQYEMIVTKKDGTPFTVEFGAKLITYGGKPSVSVVIRDVTERKRAEEALKESEEHYSALVKNLTDAVFLFKGGVITWCNDRVEEIYGYPKNELLGKHASFFYPKDVGPSEFTRILSSALKERWSFNGTTKFQRKNGSIVDIEYSLSIISGKAPIGIMAVARDITESKLVERERERMLAELIEKTKELEQIIYVTSHDLRSPLVNIQGFTGELGQACTQLHEALNSKDIPSALRERLAPTLNEDVPYALQHILASSSKMDSLLSGLLRLSRLGRVALDIKKLDMNKLMSEVVASFEFLVKETGATVKVEELPPCYGDETQINQVFSNLLDNSLKFLDTNRPGAISISGKEAKGQAIYCVQDNGIGIADKDKDVIFEIFRRLNHDAKRGEGLGLTIVRKILEKHGGKGWVESELGKGSRFFVSLPNKEKAK